MTSDNRPQKPTRIVVKVGTSILTGPGGEPDRRRIRALVGELAELRLKGAEAVIVSSGAIAAGMGPLGLTRRPGDMATLQAAAAVGQRKLMDLYADAFQRSGLTVGQVLLTRFDMVQRKHYVNARNTLQRLLKLGAVPIVNENDTVAVEEIRYGDNDLLAALVANLVNADLLVMLSDVEGLYAGDPTKNAVLLSAVTEPLEVTREWIRGKSALGSGGMASKLEAANIATLSGVHVVVASGRRKGILNQIWNGEEVGTHFPARRSRIQARKLWIAWAPTAKGKVFVDEGAVRALRDGNKSLLAAGVRTVDGPFRSGDVVEVTGPDGLVVGRGLVNFDSDALAGLAGTKADREVIHRDQLVIL